MSTIHLTGGINFETAAMARHQLLAELECGDDLYINLSSVTRIDNTGLAVLAEIYQTGRQMGCTVHLAGVRDEVMGMVRYANIDRIFAIRGDGPCQMERSYQGQPHHSHHRQRTDMWSLGHPPQPNGGC